MLCDTMNLNMFKKGTSEYFLLKQLVKRNFSAKYKDSVLGIFWSFLNPLLTMIALTIIFGALFKRSIENFPVFFLIGRCLYDYFSHGTKIAMNSLKSNKGILERIHVPKYIFGMAGIISEFINYAITLIILVAVMIATSCPFHFVALFSIIPMLLLTGIIIGVGFILAIGASFFTDIKYLYNVVTMILMYASAIFYPIEVVPKAIRKYMELNPIYVCIAQMRQMVLTGTLPPLSSFLYALAWAVGLIILGAIIFKKYQKKIIRQL